MNEQRERWQVAGNAPEVYERELVPAIFGPWAPIMVDLARPREGDRVLDVACGTGIVARTAAVCLGASGKVVGLDMNAGMLRVAQAVSAKILRPGVQMLWQEASADKLPFPDHSFDIAYCQLGLQFFPDRPAALSEMRRVLAPEGKLALMVWRSIAESPGFAALAASLERHIGEGPAAIMRAPFALSEANELATLVGAAGFHDVAIQRKTGTVRFSSVEKLVTSYIAGSPLAGPVSQADEASRNLLVADMAHALRGYTNDGAVAFPISAHLLSAQSERVR